MDNSSGKMGERYVLQMLLEQGYTFIDANYHSRFGEIDIIVKDNKYIVFVEVKTRDAKSISTPLEAVTFAKKKKLYKQLCCIYRNIQTFSIFNQDLMLPE